MIELMPKWVLENTTPSFYDKDSLTVIEATAKLYGKMNELITEYNKFADDVNAKIEAFTAEIRDEQLVFATALRQEFQDFIDTVELKLESAGVDSRPIYTNITLPASAWMGADSPYSQVVRIVGATANSKVDLLPTVEQLEIFKEKDLTFVTENDGGEITVYAVGDKPQNDYVIQATITEVVL